MYLVRSATIKGMMIKDDTLERFSSVNNNTDTMTENKSVVNMRTHKAITYLDHI